MFRFAWILTALLLVPGAHADVSIEDVAPESSFLILGIDNARDTIDRFKETALWDLLHAEEMNGGFEDSLERFEKMIETVEMEVGLEEGALRWPEGRAGMAAFLAMNDDYGIETAGLIGLLDFKDQRENLQRLIEAALEQADAADIPFDEIMVAGHAVYAFDIPQRGGADEGFDEIEAGPLGDPLSMIEPMLLGLERVYLTRVDDSMICCTNLEVLRSAIEAVEGEEVASVGDLDAYQDALAQVGEHDGHAVLLMNGFTRFAQMQSTIMIFGPMLAEPLRVLGLSNVTALSGSIDLDAPDAVLVQRAAVLIDGEKEGVVGLIERETPRTRIPRFMSDGAVGVSRLNVEFDGAMDLVNDVVTTLPFQIQEQAEAFMLEHGGDLSALLASLGDEVYMINRGEGRSNTIAVRAADARRFETAMSRLAPLLEITRRDFSGMTIYSPHDPASPAMSIGVGGGYVFLGDAISVEDALRASADVDRDVMDGEGAVLDAADAALGRDPVVAWGYTDTGAMLQSMRDAMQQRLAMMPMDMDVQEIDLDAFARDPEFITRYIGPSAWSVRSVENGFILTSYTLHPVRH